MIHKVLIIGGEQVLSNALVERLTVDHEVKLLTYIEALVPHRLRMVVEDTDMVLLLATDTFLGLGEALDNILVMTESVVDTVLAYDKPLIMVNSVLALGRAVKDKEISADMPWSDDPDWHRRSFVLHLADRIYWRGIAEGMTGHSILLPIVMLDDAASCYAMHASDFIDKHIFPQGAMGFVEMKTVISRLLVLIQDHTVDEEREILIDTQMSYKDWLDTFAARHDLPEPSKVIPPLSKGLYGYLQKMLGYHKGYDSSYLSLLSTQYRYSVDELINKS